MGWARVGITADPGNFPALHIATHLDAASERKLARELRVGSRSGFYHALLALCLYWVRDYAIIMFAGCGLSGDRASTAPYLARSNDVRLALRLCAVTEIDRVIFTASGCVSRLLLLRFANRRDKNQAHLANCGFHHPGC